MKPVLSKVTNDVRLLSQEEAEREDRVFGHSMSPDERLAAAEELRQIAYGYNPLTTEFKMLLSSLNSNGVEYLVVGGYAVIYYGYVRTTGDLDIWVALDNQNAVKIETVVRSLGFNPPGLKPEWFLRKGAVLRIGSSPLRFDIVNNIDGVSFSDCYPRREKGVIDGIDVPLIGLEDLKVNKKASGRNKDLADLDYLP